MGATVYYDTSKVVVLTLVALFLTLLKICFIHNSFAFARKNVQLPLSH